MNNPNEPYDFRNPPPDGRRPGPGPGPGPRPPHDHRPGQHLPIYPTFHTEVINGVKYKVYWETDWNQVITEDGVSLRDLLRGLPIYDKEKFYRFKGIIKNRPDLSAMDQLYAIPHPHVGDVWLVETTQVVAGKYVCEVYVFLDPSQGWTYQGTTNRQVSTRLSLSKTLQLIPDDLGDADSFLIISKDGTKITWGNPIKEHNLDLNAHPDIRKAIEEISVKSKSLLVFNDTILMGNWTYNGSNGYYEYVYQNAKIPVKSYFEITPVIEDKMTSRVITNAGMNATYKVVSGDNYSSYAILKSRRVPSSNIEISVKVFGNWEFPKGYTTTDSQETPN